MCGSVDGRVGGRLGRGAVGRARALHGALGAPRGRRRVASCRSWTRRVPRSSRRLSSPAPTVASRAALSLLRPTARQSRWAGGWRAARGGGRACALEGGAELPSQECRGESSALVGLGRAFRRPSSELSWPLGVCPVAVRSARGRLRQAPHLDGVVGLVRRSHARLLPGTGGPPRLARPAKGETSECPPPPPNLVCRRCHSAGGPARPRRGAPLGVVHPIAIPAGATRGGGRHTSVHLEQAWAVGDPTQGRPTPLPRLPNAYPPPIRTHPGLDALRSRTQLTSSRPFPRQEGRIWTDSCPPGPRRALASDSANAVPPFPPTTAQNSHAGLRKPQTPGLGEYQSVCACEAQLAMSHRIRRT